MTPVTGPLHSVKVIELGGIGPSPHAGMVLADLGADVVRIRRPGDPSAGRGREELLHRGKRVVDLDVKRDLGTLMDLIAKADVVLDGFRPGVCERLGVGPDACSTVNPRLIFARITGWGQDGPLSMTAGHDINYLSQTGALSAIGYRDRPPLPPLNLVADFAGGSMFALLGIVAALYEREQSGLGQVIDAAMVDGVSALAQLYWEPADGDTVAEADVTGLVDGSTPYYSTYATSDGKFIAVGAIEPQFFAQLLAGLELSPEDVPDQGDPGSFDRMRAIFAARFATKTRDEWARVFFRTDACVTPVLSWREAVASDHLRARSTIIERGESLQASSAPRFSRFAADTIGIPPTRPTPIDAIGW